MHSLKKHQQQFLTSGVLIGSFNLLHYYSTGILILPSSRNSTYFLMLLT